MSATDEYSWVEELYQEELFQVSCTTLVVIPEPWAALGEGDKALLAKILTAVKVGLAGARIISEPVITRARLQQLNPRYVLVFGSKLETPAAPGEVFSIDEAKVINAGRLDSLDEPAKKILWSALQELYSL